jgi:hypothetical protein
MNEIGWLIKRLINRLKTICSALIMNNAMVHIVKIVITFIIVLLFAVLLYFLNRTSRKKRLIVINSNREALSKDRYVNMLVKRGYPKHHVSALYDMIMEYINVKGFYPYPDDDFLKTYELTEINISKFFNRLCDKFALAKFTKEDVLQFEKDFEVFNAESVLSVLEKQEARMKE